MKSKIQIFLVLFLLILGLSACGDKTLSGGVIPIYRGMTLSSESVVTNTNALSLLETVDDEFVDDVEDAFGIITSEEIEYYAAMNETLYLTITIYNPDSFEILSFTLNGKKYQSYQFEDGSDSEQLILTVDTGTIPGIIEFTIDAIKYIDGTAISDVRMDGEQTVKVGIEYSTIPFSTITNQIIGSSSIDLTAKITDYADLIALSGNNLKIFLYDGLQIIEEKDILVGVNSVVFDQLQPNKEYQYIIAAAYDIVDGNGVQIVVLHEESFQTAALVGISNIISTSDSIAFSLEINDENAVGSVENIKLFLGDVLIDEITEEEEMIFANLLSNNTYEIRLTYTYDLNDGAGIQTKEDSTLITTEEKQDPTISTSNVGSTPQTILFDLVIEDIDQVGQLTLIELYLDGLLVDSITNLSSLTGLQFINLLTNNTYEIKATYSYDLNDGTGVKILVESEFVSTVAKIVPTIAIIDILSSVTSVTFDLDISDIDAIGALSDISILKNGVVVQTLTDLNLRYFSGLLSDSAYEIQVTYTYDALDGNGNQDITTSQAFFTAPYLGIISTEVINTEKLTEGDTLVIEITVDNPSNITFTRVIINGQYYEVSNVTTTSFIRVEFIIDSSYTGGETEFVIERIEGFNQNQAREFEVSENNVGVAFVNGDVFVESISIVDENGLPLDFAMPGDIFYVRIVFDNPTQYLIENVSLSYIGTIDSDRFTISEDYTVITIQQTCYYSNTIIDYNLYSFTYSSESIGSKTKNIDNMSDFVVCVTNSNYQYIYTVNDLINIQNGYAYRLANDIDLTGIEWTPKDISFIVLDGNGFSISNLRMIKTIVDSQVYSGLFRTINYSSIKNLSVNDYLAMITVNNSSTSSEFQVYAGIISGNSYLATYENITVQGEISINNTTGGEAIVGGIVGSSQQTSFSQIYTNVILSGKNAVGGITGRGYDVIINRVFTSGSLYSNREVGGIIGNAYNSTITNSYSNVSINVSEWTAGGLFGYGGNIYVKNCYYTGTITSPYNDVGGIIGNGYNITILDSFANAVDSNGNPIAAIYSVWEVNAIENVYSLVDETYAIQSTLAEIYQQMALIWNPIIWSFGQNQPVLKWTPSVRIVNVVAGETVITFGITSTDFDQVGEIYSVEIFKGSELIQTLDNVLETRFEDLRYNTAYVIKVVYTFNYGDELGDQFITTYLNVKTLPVSGTPSITFGDIIPSSQTVDFSYTIVDDLEVGDLYSIEIFDENNQLIDSLEPEETLHFENLSSNKSYTIKITLSYDLGDSYGVQYAEFTRVFRTNPYVEIVGTSILNTDAIIIGDTLVIQIDIDNPDDAEFIEARINGEVYSVSSSSMTRVRIDVPTNESFSTGEVDIIVEELTATFMNQVYTYYLSENNSTQTFINGDIYVLTIQTVDQNGVDIDYLAVGDTYYVRIEFYNPTIYSIDSINLFTSYYMNAVYTDFDINEDHTIVLIHMTVPQEGQYQRVSVSAFTYSSEIVEEKSRQVSGMDVTFSIVKDTIIHDIYTVDDLESIESGYYYRLMNDINLTGVSWTPIENFYGVFDGNGYTISNLSIVKTYEDQTVYAGLFAQINGGIIRNLSITNVSFVITVRTGSTNGYQVYIGGLAGEISGYSNVSNIVVSGDIDVTNETNGETFAGILAGNVYQSTFDRIYTSGAVSGKRYVGGVIGVANNSIITNSYTNATVTGLMEYIGGFIGQMSGTVIEDCYANGMLDVNNQYWALGGFAGYVDNSRMSNVLSSTTNLSHSYVEPIGYAYNHTFENTYSLGYSAYFTQVTYENAMIAMQTGWDLSLWSFSAEYPVLKRIPTVNISNVVTNEYDLSFEISITDYDEVGEIYSIELYQLGILVESLTDLSSREFDELRYSTTYVIKIIYCYDYGDAYGEAFIETTLSVRTQDKENVPVITFNDVDPTVDSVTFNYQVTDVLSVGTLDSIELYDANNQLVEVLEGEYLAFENLLSNTTYFIQINYLFNFDDGFGDNILNVQYEFKTVAKQTPTLNFDWIPTTSDSATINYTISDVDQVGSLTSVEIYNNDVLIGTIDGTIDQTFTNLQSSTTYMIKGIYTYDLNDGFGNRTISAYYWLTTGQRTIPQVVLNDSIIYEDSIMLYAELIDPDQIGEIINIRLYQGTTLISTSPELDCANFVGLLPNVIYTVKIDYSYDLNDGQGARVGRYNYDFQTAPSAEVLSTDIVNIEALSIGEMLLILLEVDNPNGIIFTEAMVNGRYFPVGSSTETRVRIDVTVDELLGGGDTIVTVEELIGVSENIVYGYQITSNNTASIFINGDIYVMGIRTIDDLGNDLEYGISGDTYYIEIEFYNPTGYDIQSIEIYDSYFGTQTILAGAFVINEAKTVITIEKTVGSSQLTQAQLNRYAFDNDMIELKERQVSGMISSFVVLHDDLIREIETVDDLKAVTGGYYYRLMNDLDLSGVSWKPIENFYGIFDGNGHVISNITIIGTYEDQSVYAGLFGRITGGIVKDLSLIQVYYVIILKTATTNGYQAYVGGLVGEISGYTKITNVMVLGDISVMNKTNGETYVGGLAGSVNSATIDRIYVIGTVAGKSNVGGLIGYANHTTVSNSYSNTSVTATGNYVGSFIGTIYESLVYDCYAMGVLYNPNNLGSYGSFIGLSYYNIIRNVFTATYGPNNSLTYPLGYLYGDSCENAYSFFYSQHFEQAALPEIMIQMMSTWDLGLWTFTGEYPALKRVPIVGITDITTSETDLGFEISIIDFDEVGEIYSVELYQGDTLIESLTDLSLRSFDELRYGTNYVIKVVYRYDYGDEAGETFTETYKMVRTSDKENVPIVTIDEVVVTQDSVTFDYDVIDTLAIGAIDSIELYDEDNILVETLVGETLTFINLLSDCNYTIQVNYIYNFDDGFGDNLIETRYDFKTSPYLAITEIVVLNTDEIIIGDVVVIRLTVDNPDQIIFTEVTINGTLYQISNVNGDILRIDVIVDDSYSGGDTPFVVESLHGYLGNRDITVYLFANNTINVFINGDIYVMNVSSVDLSYNELEYTVSGASYLLKVEFYNPTGYEINSIRVYGDIYQLYEGASITLNAENTIAYITLTANSGNYYQYQGVDQFSYSNERIDERTRAVAYQSSSFVIVTSDTIIPITTVEELQNMENGLTYQLMNDLDLSGVNWIPIVGFNGCLDGNGYTISNLSIVKTYEDQNAQVGLFANIHGAVIKNLNIENFNYIITLRTYVSGSYSGYVGGLVGNVESYSQIRNVHTNGQISFTNNTSGVSYVGGVIGTLGTSSIVDDCSATGTFVQLGNENSHVGGLIGRAEGAQISKSFAIASVSGFMQIGGFIGSANNTLITDCYASSIVTATSYYAGGFIGNAEGTAIKNSYANSILVNGINQWAVGGFAGYSGSTSYENVYSQSTNINGIYIIAFGYVANCESINTYGFVPDSFVTIKTLNDIIDEFTSIWDHTIWDFVNVDDDGNPTLI
ncbi:MAG: hypothetical protein ABII85_04645 [Bacillota bacterium]